MCFRIIQFFQGGNTMLSTRVKLRLCYLFLMLLKGKMMWWGSLKNVVLDRMDTSKETGWSGPEIGLKENLNLGRRTLPWRELWNGLNECLEMWSLQLGDWENDTVINTDREMVRGKARMEGKVILRKCWEEERKGQEGGSRKKLREEGQDINIPVKESEWAWPLGSH